MTYCHLVVATWECASLTTAQFEERRPGRDIRATAPQCKRASRYHVDRPDLGAFLLNAGLSRSLGRHLGKATSIPGQKKSAGATARAYLRAS
jgi:hypothetical protein